MDFGNRKEAFRALVGSHNYNLNGENSDRDYKVFVIPTFNDLYFNKQFSKSYIGKTEDFDCHDIRKLSQLWWKSNVNFIEVLYSIDITINEDLSEESKNLLKHIFNKRKELVKMNLPYLWNACIGMHLTKKNQIYKGTEGTKHLVDQFGYDTKQACHSVRILDFLRRFSTSNFEDFKEAIYYDDNDPFRQVLLNIKNGKYSAEEFETLCDALFEEITNDYKEIYLSKQADVNINDELIDTIKQLVKLELL